MTVLMVVGCGLMSSFGAVLIVVGLRGIEERPDSDSLGGTDKSWADIGTRLANIEQLRLRLILAVIGAIGMGILAPWPVGIALAALGGFSTPTLLGAQKRRQAAVNKTEAIATWAEQLRDTIGSAAGLQEAITVTAKVAPKEIRPHVQALALGTRRHSLSVLLRRFAHDVDDPAADQVAVALILASERRGQNLIGLLSDVADAARQEAMMRMRTETSRSQTYSDAKAVTLVVLVVFGLLLVLNKGYLSPFDTVGGQFVLACVGAMWVSAIYSLGKLSEVRRGPRILSVVDSDLELM